jgi:hypothetical protein
MKFLVKERIRRMLFEKRDSKVDESSRFIKEM